MMVDATSGGGLMNKSATQAKEMFENIAANTGELPKRKQSFMSTQGFIRETRQTHAQMSTTIKSLENQVGQIAASLSQREPGKLPSQVIPDPNGGHELKSVTLRSGKEVEKDDNEERNSTKTMAAPSPKLTVPSDNSKEVPIPGKDLPLILGHPFMRKARTKIGVYEGTLTMALDEETVEFKVFDALKYPNDDHACFSIDVLEQRAPQVELKPLPKNLKYAYLGDEKTLIVIIASNLRASEEDKLIPVLREQKTALGWTIVDIRGISPTKCMHMILLE
ncbi:hypothetical protein L3X38_033014 [Prunus dulcis]|uniref:Uncharacterized protein n=1 Tax=Prunus dulcis TaxID=3755 RepID=A0AAD4VHA3_PRUDU|nr:hypothetical protein L3X38_033014 [Prunus dulcis]